LRIQHRLRHAHARSLLISAGLPSAVAPPDPPEVTIGERLFLETRFAQYFATHLSGNSVNQPLTQGDPTVDYVQMAGGKVLGPFAGKSMNCRSCHFVDELGDADGGGNRTYADLWRGPRFQAVRTISSPLPATL
jgi:hypothetical protein